MLMKLVCVSHNNSADNSFGGQELDASELICAQKQTMQCGCSLEPVSCFLKDDTS